MFILKGREVSICWELSAKPQRPFSCGYIVCIWNISILPFFLTLHTQPLLPDQSPLLPFQMSGKWPTATESILERKHRCKLLCFIPLACAIHMAGSEQNTRCSQPSLLFEACSKGLRADLTWKHLLNKRVHPVPLGERKGEKQSFCGLVKANRTKAEERCRGHEHTGVWHFCRISCD